MRAFAPLRVVADVAPADALDEPHSRPTRAVDRLVDHVEDHSDYEQPDVATEGAGEAAEGEHADTGEETEEAAP